MVIIPISAYPSLPLDKAVLAAPIADTKDTMALLYLVIYPSLQVTIFQRF